jgi:NADP-dependent aldehyde dehydrogenase
MTADRPGTPDPPDSSPDELETVLAAAARAAPVLAAWSPADRARLLRALGAAVDDAADDLVPLAMHESALPEVRLRGELARASGQLRLFAEVVEEGSFLEVVIDNPDPAAVPVPRPDLRRMLVPLGPVLVFAAGNFPFAFSVPGGDTAAALAAGCPVVVKAHPGHPRLALRTVEVLQAAVARAGAPEGTVALVLGTDAGVAALRDRRTSAAAFTGSLHGGRALHDIACARPDPIPFYGELGSINPVVVSPGAVRERAGELVRGYVGSFSLGIGQFCTKPGLLLLPRGHDMEELLAEEVRVATGGRMLTPGISDAFARGLAQFEGLPGVRRLATGAGEGGAVPTLFALDAPTFLAHADALLTECFGPSSLVVEYDGQAQLEQVVDVLTGSLTATVHGSESEAAELEPLVRRLHERAGRVIWNGWPTGVAVAWAMHHGGPWPATVGSVHTSVGATAVRRFQRPVCYQDAPAAVLPAALRDGNPLGVPRRIDGRMEPAAVERLR